MKFQDSSFNGLKVTVGTKSVTHAPTHARTHARSKSNMPHQLSQSWGHKYSYICIAQKKYKHNLLRFIQFIELIHFILSVIKFCK